MAQVQTVLGPISPEELGITAMHEHIVYGMPGWEYAPEVNFDRSSAFEKIKKDLLDFKSAGGKTIVDCSGVANGRDIEFYQALSRTTGVNIVASTGFGAEPGIPGHFASTSYSTKAVDYVVEMFLQELNQGMITGFMKKTNVRAGIICVGNMDNRITATEEKFYRAAARTAIRTGCAVMTQGPQMARKQIDLMIEEGLKPDRIIIGQCDRFPDIERDKDIAKMGAYIAYDSVAYDESPEPGKRRIESIKAMVDAGLQKRVIISVDAIGYALGFPQPKRTYRYLPGGLLEELRHAGIDEKTINTFLVENPRNVLIG